MLFFGLGTGFGSTLIADGIVEPMELGHLPYKSGTYEDYVGNHALLKHGKTKWRRHVADVVIQLTAALEPDEVVIGGGNAKELEGLPPKCRLGDNHNAFVGGFRLWEEGMRAVVIGEIKCNQAGVRFLLTALEVALSFIDMAGRTSNLEDRQRLFQGAREAHDTAQQLRPSFIFSSPEIYR